jgi:pilus assembly protein Flp/PilA
MPIVRTARLTGTVRILQEDDAVTAIEYGLLAALIAVTCIVAFQATGGSLEAIYNYWSGAVNAAL